MCESGWVSQQLRTTKQDTVDWRHLRRLPLQSCSSLGDTNP